MQTEIRPILEEEITVTGQRVQVALSHIDEGQDGDYNPENPKDTPLLRMDISRRGNDGGTDVDDHEWGIVRNGSFCTQIDARISSEEAKAIAQSVVDLLDKLPSSPSHIELLSWASSAKDIQTGFRVGYHGKHPYLMQATPMHVKDKYPCLRITAPELLEDKAFCKWLTTSATVTDRSGCATWHRGPQKPGEYSDIFLWKDSGKEGSDSDMPEHVWEKLCALAGEDFVGILWVDFLE